MGTKLRRDGPPLPMSGIGATILWMAPACKVLVYKLIIWQAEHCGLDFEMRKKLYVKNYIQDMFQITSGKNTQKIENLHHKSLQS